MLSSAEKVDLIRQMRSHPESFCAQEIVSNATIPIYKDSRLQSRHFQLRVFLIPDGNSWRMMPGGLARYAAKENDLIVSMQRGGESKDTWVLRDSKSAQGKIAAPNIASKEIFRRNSNDLPSRTAENLFWLGRYIERTESQARLLRALGNLLINQIDTEDQSAILPFLEQVAEPGSDLSKIIDADTGLLNFSDAETIVLRAAYDPDNAESLVSNLGYIKRASSKVKERLSVDIWKRLLGMQYLANQPISRRPSVFDEELTLLVDKAIEDLASFVGNLSENMTRSQGWRFLQIGRRLERGLAIGFLLRSAFKKRSLVSETLLSNLLDWADSAITYRRRYLNALQEDRVLDLLCFDSSNPRSLAFQIDNICHALASLPHSGSGLRHPIDKDALKVYSRLSLSEPAALLSDEKKGNRNNIIVFFDAVCDDLHSISTKIEQQYFAHTTMAPERQAETLLG